MDGGIDGITLAAGLHLGSFGLIEDHPRFRDVKLGIIVSSVRALQLFLRKSGRTNRLPDYVVVEGPLAGGHLGFGMDWREYDLATITKEVVEFIKTEAAGQYPCTGGRWRIYRHRCGELHGNGRGRCASGNALYRDARNAAAG